MNCENSNSESGITQNILQNSSLSANTSVSDVNICFMELQRKERSHESNL